MDLAGAVEARTVSKGHDVATIAAKDIQFLAPLKVGEVVTWYAKVVKVGKTSITISIEVEDSDGYTVAIAVFIYVAVRDNNGTLEKVQIGD